MIEEIEHRVGHRVGMGVGEEWPFELMSPSEVVFVQRLAPSHVHLLVIPPDDTNFQGTTDPCAFFRQAEHTFLWVTSPHAVRAKGSYVFDSSPFYAVSPLEDRKRMFVAQDHSRPEQRRRAGFSISQ